MSEIQPHSYNRHSQQTPELPPSLFNVLKLLMKVAIQNESHVFENRISLRDKQIKSMCETVKHHNDLGQSLFKSGVVAFALGFFGGALPIVGCTKGNDILASARNLSGWALTDLKGKETSEYVAGIFRAASELSRSTQQSEQSFSSGDVARSDAWTRIFESEGHECSQVLNRDEHGKLMQLFQEAMRAHNDVMSRIAS